MTKEQKYIVALSKAAIFDEVPPIPPENLDWKYIWYKSLEQSISGLLASAVLKLPEKNQPDNAAQWRTVMMQTMLFMSRKNAEFERMTGIIKSNGIDPVCLKGCVVRRFYPIESLRSMSDFDIWVDKEHRKAAEDIFRAEGYTADKNTLFTALDKDKIHGELFISLEDDFRTEPSRWDRELRDNTYINEGKRILTPTYELAYSIVHTAKHLTREGCGLRNMLDAALILKHENDDIDFDKAYLICKSQGYEKVFSYIISAAKDWYGLDISYKTISGSDKFLEYMLSDGIYGKATDDNVLAKQIVRREGDDVSEIRRIFFPPRRMIQHKYQYVKKSPLLLPVAWTHRFLNAVFVKHHSVRDMAKDINAGIDYGKDRDKWLKELGL